MDLGSVGNKPERSLFTGAKPTGPRSIVACKLQASSLTAGEGYSRINYERNNMDQYSNVVQLKRIADALEEILRLVKKDMEPRTKKD